MRRWTVPTWAFRKVEGEYGLGFGCYAEPRVGESIGSTYKNKLVRTEDRLMNLKMYYL